MNSAARVVAAADPVRGMSRPILVLLIVVLAGSASAQQQGPTAHVVNWYTLDGGGGTSNNGDFSLTGTIGQPDADTQPATSSGYVLAGGYWAHVFDYIFEDSFEDQ